MIAHRLAVGFLAVSLLTLPACGSGPGAKAPSFRYAKAKEGGCADLFFHKATADDLEVLWIVAEKDKLKIAGKGKWTFDLDKAPDGVIVAVDLWAKAPRFSAYCNDISPDTKRLATWKATQGKLIVTVHDDIPPGPGMKSYKASARLEGVVFEGPDQQRSTLKEETITEVMVGWYAG